MIVLKEPLAYKKNYLPEKLPNLTTKASGKPRSDNFFNSFLAFVILLNDP